MTDTNGELRPEPLESPPASSDAVPAAPLPRRRHVRAIVGWSVAVLLAAGLVGTNMWLFGVIDEAQRLSATHEQDAKTTGVELGALRTEAAEFHATIDVLNTQVSNGAGLLATLGTDVTSESATTAKWRDAASALGACDKARKKVIDSIHSGGSSSTSSADATCKAAFAEYKKIKAAE